MQNLPKQKKKKSIKIMRITFERKKNKDGEIEKYSNKKTNSSKKKKKQQQQ
jgi:hypothetical protein